jgi:polysaccharide biosynthesis transport protein
LNPADLRSAAAAPAGRSISDYGAMIKRRWVSAVSLLSFMILASVLVAYLLPPLYRSTAIILLQPSSIPRELITTTVKDLDDVSNVAQTEVELVRRKVMDPDELVPLVKQLDPYPLRKDLTLEAKAEMVSDNTSVERVDPITGKPLDTSTAFAIHYLNGDPKLSKQVGRLIVEQYLTYNRRTRTEQAAAAYQFLSTQAKELEGSMVQMEQKLAGFREKYGGALPEMQAHNLQRIDGLQHDLENTQHELLNAEDRESQAQLQLATLSPSLSNAVTDWKTQLGKTQADLIDAEQKYTPEHPEVKRLKRALADLRAQGTNGAKIGAATPDNPDYLAMKGQLDTASHEVINLRAQEVRERADMAQYEKNMMTMPNVQRDYTALQRDYDNSRERYEDLQTKMKNAALAQTMEAEARGEKFTLVHEVTVPKTPYFPNRLGIILLGVVLGGALAFGVAAMVDASDPTVRGTRDLTALLNSAAIGTIPRMLNPADKRKQKFAWATGLIAYAAAIALVTFIVVIDGR